MSGSWLISVMWATPAFAEPNQVPHVLPPITWTAPESCPDQDQVVRRVHELLADPESQGSSYLSAIDGHVRADRNSGYEVTLEFVTGSGRRQRQLNHANCEKLTEAAALVIAMAIDPEHVQTTTGQVEGAGSSVPLEREPSSPMHRGPERTRVSVPQQQENPTTAASSGIGWGWQIGGGIRAGITPRLEPTIDTGLEVAPWSSWRLGATAYYGFDESKVVERSTGAEAVFSSWGLGVRGCWRTGAVVNFGVCVGGEYIGVAGAGRNVGNPEHRRDHSVAAWLGLQPGFRVATSLRIVLDLGAGANLRRPRFSMQGLGEVYRPELLQLRCVGAVALDW